MSYDTRISSLNESVRLLDAQILEATDPSEIEALKNKKSTYEAEIRRLIRIQFEEDTQRVYFDDDR